MQTKAEKELVLNKKWKLFRLVLKFVLFISGGLLILALIIGIISPKSNGQKQNSITLNKNMTSPAKTTAIPFDELGVFKHPVNNPSYAEIFIYTSTTKHEDIQKIINIYKKRYSGLIAFQIFFFNDRHKSQIGELWLGGAGNMSDETWSCEIGHYIFNTTDKSEKEEYLEGPAGGLDPETAKAGYKNHPQ
jgi:hypothetical protein